MEPEVNGVNVQEAAEPAMLQEQPEQMEPMEPENITPEGENKTETAEPSPGPERDYERDAAFARMRREAEEARRENRRLTDALRRYDLKGETADDLADAAEAYHTGAPLDAIRKAREAERALQTLREENEQFRERERARIFDDDLKRIRKAYPEVKAGKIGELGEDFMRLRANGIDPIIAYEAVRKKTELETKPKPPSMGSVNTTGASPRGYFTPEEVKQMSPAEVQKNYEAIEKSMKHWR